MPKFPQLYPLVAKVITPQDFAAGVIVGSRPLGVTVHDTADRDLQRALASLRQEKLGYHLIIDRDGLVYQTAFLDRRVNHAGEAMWGRESPNRWYAAVAVVSWGLLGRDKKTWTGETLPDADVVERPGNLAKTPAFWDAATPDQEASLRAVLSWFVVQGVDPANICGHDECALPRGRKSDPGGVLSTTMSQLRASLKGKQ